MKWKLLIVDDEPINLEFFDVMLSKLGFEVEKAVDGEDALEKVKEFVPDLIILDNVMPKLPGWEVTRRLKKTEEYKDFRHIPIIIFSALDGVDNKIEAIDEGAEDYITKPFSFREVLARIRGVLNRRELALQIGRREKRIEVIEALNNMLLTFYKQVIKTPLKELVDAAKKAGNSATEAVKVCALTKNKGEEILEHLAGLDEKVDKLQSRRENLKEGDLTPEELEKKFKQLFNTLQNFEEEKNEDQHDAQDEEGKGIELITEEKRKILELFATGRNLYKLQKFEEAKAYFEKALGIDSKDGPSIEYKKRCIEFIEAPPGPDWDGVYTMKNK